MWLQEIDVDPTLETSTVDKDRGRGPGVGRWHGSANQTHCPTTRIQIISFTKVAQSLQVPRLVK